MVDLQDLQQASRLATQKEGLQRAAEALANKLPIDNMSIAGVLIPVAGMPFPQQMADALQGEIQHRIGELDQQLTNLGVVTTPPTTPEPAGARGAKAKKA